MKIRTVLAYGATIGAVVAGGLSLTPGTAQAAVNCTYLSNQAAYYRMLAYGDWQAFLYFYNQGDNVNADDAFNSYLQDSAVVRIYRNAYSAQCPS
jgi:hypothetical protein